MDWESKQDVTMDFPDDARSEDKIAPTLTQLAEILGHISNALGTGIDFDAAPITKKPTSKKVEIGTSNETDKTTLGNKSIPGMAISQAKPKTMQKSINPLNNKSRDFTGLSLNKEDIDAVVEENMSEQQGELDTEKIAFGLGAIGARMGAAAAVNSKTDDERKGLSAKQKKLDVDGDGKLEGSDFKALSEKKAMSPMSTSDGKALLATLEDTVKQLEKFLNTTKVSSANALKPQDMRPSNVDYK